jgi:hypothetical protein
LNLGDLTAKDAKDAKGRERFTTRHNEHDEGMKKDGSKPSLVIFILVMSIVSSW